VTSSFRQRPRLAVGVIGVGRVGSVLGAALARAGHAVVAASAVSDASRRRAERLLPGVPLCPPDEVAKRSTLVLLAVPDDALPALVSGLAVTGAFRPGQIAVHTSGRYGLAVLAPAAALGVLPLALHPVMTFAGSSTDLSRLAGATFGVTAPPELGPVAAALVLEMGAEPSEVAEGSRELYHAALAHGANHLVTLVNSATDVLRAAGITDPAGMVGPLLSAALDNALHSGDSALTGPVSRGDAETVAAHLDALAREAPAQLPLYRALARATADRALAARIVSPSQVDAIHHVLADHDRADPYGPDPDGARA
jgi:predicted short-subunit dehydrogenase-like oxidoreductase (DUF2520 family)